MKRILRHQRDHNTNCIQSDDLESERVNRLMGNLGKQKDRVTRANYKERTDDDFTPYKMISEINQIEDYLWNFNCTTATFSAASLQDCYQCLSTLGGGVLRSESLCRGNFSNL